MTHHNSHVRASTHGGRGGLDKWRGAGRPGRNIRNRSTGTRNIPFHTPTFRPFALFAPLDDQQDEDDAFAAGDNRMSTGLAVVHYFSK
ncbi:hypothetical protein RvY_01279 [Ramazzottius varieornatus]|uniref:Uncharacterized protein n=1 Tax=Ramazzottius varieornatus TaxID=947166 RepID=A0A1D1UJB8_RAMVA|nr:hypothetical protein RvY_01279 [Ramazzottius varieornatus]